MNHIAGDMIRGLRDVCESNAGKICDNREAHPDIVKLYDDIEDRLYDFVMCIYKEWPKLRKKEEEEIRDITRDIVGDIGKLWIHSPYFNKDYPMKI